MRNTKDSKAFLKLNLKKIFLEIDGIEISYEFRSSSNTHLVEIKPERVYDSKAYIDKELRLEEEFNNYFPEEDLMFITENSLTKIKSPEFSFRFKIKYDQTNLYTHMDIPEFPRGKQQFETNLALAS